MYLLLQQKNNRLFIQFMNKQAFYNGSIFTGTSMQDRKALLIADHAIIDVVSDEEIPSDYTKVDIGGALLAPAFIDLQIYGGNGKLFSEEMTVETIEQTYAYSKTGGAHHFMITLATNSEDVFYAGIEAVRAYWNKGGKGLLGLHLEGPFLNVLKKGAHLAQYIHVPTLAEVKALMKKGRDVIKMMTLAPECCDPLIIQYLQEQGVLISLGHSNATFELATKAFDAGIPLATHLYNAMSGLQHRSPGVVGAILDHPKVCSSVVCDGIHVDYAAIRIAKKIMQDRLFYITDAVTESNTGGYMHLKKKDHFALPDGTLSGSSLTMLQCVQNGIQHVNISLEESLRMASLYPAKFLGNRKLGRLERGWEAEFIILDKQSFYSNTSV